MRPAKLYFRSNKDSSAVRWHTLHVRGALNLCKGWSWIERNLQLCNMHLLLSSFLVSTETSTLLVRTTQFFSHSSVPDLKYAYFFFSSNFTKCGSLKVWTNKTASVYHVEKKNKAIKVHFSVKVNVALARTHTNSQPNASYDFFEQRTHIMYT